MPSRTNTDLIVVVAGWMHQDESPAVTNVASLSDVVALAVSESDLLPSEKVQWMMRVSVGG
jgi:hypothetical protein